MRINALLPAMLRSILGKMIFVNSNAHYITLMTGDKYSNTFSFEYNNPPPVANRSMEISSPRLHHGRAASYGSIIIAACCHRQTKSNLAFPVGLIAPPFGHRGAPLHRLFQTVTWSCFQDFLMTVYSVFKLPEETASSSPMSGS